MDLVSQSIANKDFVKPKFLDVYFQNVAKIQGNTRESDFIHKGKTGRWEEVYSKETIKRFEEWETKWLDGTGLSFTYKI